VLYRCIFKTALQFLHQKDSRGLRNCCSQDRMEGKSSIPKPSESDDIPRNRQRRGRFPHTLPPAVAGTRTGHLVERVKEKNVCTI
ncbi:hypothetical protein TNCT_681791, partial [Trichonephila clavata]